MKKVFPALCLALGLCFFASSCYTVSYSVGSGAQTGVETKSKNHFLIYGLAPIGSTSPVEMAKGAENYDVTITHSFVDGLISALTAGIYTPTTTIVKR